MRKCLCLPPLGSSKLFVPNVKISPSIVFEDKAQRDNFNKILYQIEYEKRTLSLEHFGKTTTKSLYKNEWFW